MDKIMLRTTTILLLCALWTSFVLAQDAPDCKFLVGVWTWRPTNWRWEASTWAAQLTITEVSDTGRVTAVWSDPHWGTIPFTTQAIVKEGRIRITFGQIAKYDLEYNKKNDTLIGPVTDLPLTYRNLPEFQTAYFRRIK